MSLNHGMRTVERRVLLECCTYDGKRPDGVGAGGCGKAWFTVTETIGIPDYWGRRTSKLALPNRCPKCNGWNIQLRAKLEVSESRTDKLHTCANTCQWSESRKCRCACGGKMHGAMLNLKEA